MLPQYLSMHAEHTNIPAYYGVNKVEIWYTIQKYSWYISA